MDPREPEQPVETDAPEPAGEELESLEPAEDRETVDERLPAEEPEESGERERGCLGRALSLGARAAGAVAVLLAVVLAYEALTWPDVAALARDEPETTAFIERWESRSGREATRAWTPYDRISPHLKRAVLVAEDIDFFSHPGFATDEMRSALETAWREKRPPRGASTITQQLAKNLWLSPSRNPLRKVKEALLTIELERSLPKRRILELYLNLAELGPGIYGAEAAARHYYGKSAADLTEREAAGLAAALPNPDDWHPGSASRRYRARVELVLRRMGRARFLWKVI